jgi:hypothetical protein
MDSHTSLSLSLWGEESKFSSLNFYVKNRRGNSKGQGVMGFFICCGLTNRTPCPGIFCRELSKPAGSGRWDGGAALF